MPDGGAEFCDSDIRAMATGTQEERRLALDIAAQQYCGAMALTKEFDFKHFREIPVPPFDSSRLYLFVEVADAQITDPNADREIAWGEPARLALKRVHGGYGARIFNLHQDLRRAYRDMLASRANTTTSGGVSQ